MRRRASLLSGSHEVTLIQAGGGEADPTSPVPDKEVREVWVRPSPALDRIAFSCDSHRRSAAVLEAIEAAYGDAAPDYLEVPDYHAVGLVALQAREAGHPLLRDTLIAVRISGTAELVSLHDGTRHQPDIELVSSLEREQLRLADRVLWRGGDTLDLYRRYYSDIDLPEAVRIRPSVSHSEAPPTPGARDGDRPLRILFAGRLQRFKGALDLAEACLGLAAEDWELTMIGADTATAPGGQSVRMTIEVMCGDDHRIEIEDPLPYAELQRRLPDYDLLVVPSTLEIWGNVAVEAMRAGLPVLATPGGGPAEIVEHGVTGWHTDGFGTDAIRQALERLLADRAEVERVRESGAIYERFLRLTDPSDVLAGYERLLESAAPSRFKSADDAADQPLVTGIIPYHRSADDVSDAVESLLSQSYRNLEVLIVNDGSFVEADAILDRLSSDPRVEVVTQLNRGEPAARDLGALLARGEYLVMLDADNALEQDFVARSVAMLRRDPELAYVTCWLRFFSSDGSEPEAGGYAPLGNRVVADDSYRSNESNNWDGDAIAILPRRVFSELGYRYEPLAALQSDWELYRHLREDGRFGAVIPEQLAKYRVRPDSLSRAHEREFQHRAWDEALSRRRKRAIEWVDEAAR